MRKETLRPTLAVLVLAALTSLGLPITHAGGAAQYYPLNTDADLARWTAHDPAVTGAVDMHLHGDPDSNFDRQFVSDSNPSGRTGQFDIIEAARIAKASGMRAIVHKSKRIDPSTLAYMARKAVPGIEVFGAMSMDRPFGMNPAAVEVMANVEGGWGRVVFMVAEDAAVGNREAARAVPVSRNGSLLPETKAVIAIIAKIKTRGSNGSLVMATGHNSPEDCLLLLREGQRAGVKSMIMTHPGPNWTMAQLQEGVKLGGYIEITALSAFLPTERLGGVDPANHKRALEVIRAIGAEHIIVSTDVGRMHSTDKVGNPTSPQAFALTAKLLRADGITEQQLNLMFKDNPSRLLGLPVAPSKASREDGAPTLERLLARQ